MTMVRKSSIAVITALLMALVVAIGSAPQYAQGADHLDAPSLTSPGGDPRLDINDLYVFEGAEAGNTVLALTVNPVAAGDSSFIDKQAGSYFLRVDTNGDAVEDITYAVSFITDADGQQKAKVREVTGKQAQSARLRGGVIGEGPVESTFALEGGGMAYTGLRSDPFFFDLGGFLGTVEGIGDRGLGDGMQSDFFADLNALAIVIEVPDARLGGSIAVWATTSSHSRGSSTQVDRIGRPAINTVVNSSGPIVGAPSAAKNVFNASKPKNDVANFTGAVVSALQAFSSLDPVEGAYSDDAAATLASVLLPDVITYDTSSVAVGPLNGRALADDVIDIELRIVTGGDVFGIFGRDADGAVNSDGVGAHTDYLTTFPYLGVPNS